LRTLCDEAGRLVVVVTHDLFVAPRWADELLVLERGALRAEEPRPLA